MKISRNSVAVGLAALVLAGVAACSLTSEQRPNSNKAAEPDSSASATSAAAAPTSAAPAQELRTQDLAAKLGCQAEAHPTQLFTKETAHCDLGGARLLIAVFAGDEQRDNWVKAGEQMGGNIVVGPAWAISADNPDAAKTVADRLGGTLR